MDIGVSPRNEAILLFLSVPISVTFFQLDMLSKVDWKTGVGHKASEMLAGS